MLMISQASPEVHGAMRRRQHQRAPIPVDLAAVCLWSALGLSLSVLVLASSFGAEIGQVLAKAG
jgi:hypothetical protein